MARGRRTRLASPYDIAVDRGLAREAAWRHRRLAVRLLVVAGCGVVLWLAAARIHLSLSNIITGVPNMADFFGRMVPPDFSILRSLIAPTIETVQIAAWGTTIAVVA